MRLLVAERRLLWRLSTGESGGLWYGISMVVSMGGRGRWLGGEVGEVERRVQ